MDDKKKDCLFRVFLAISLVWTAGVSWFLFKDQALYNGYSPMPLNEIGDFLAGSFSPLAFFWLTYGYMLQAKQIKENTKTSKNAENLSIQQFEYQKIKEQNDAQPTFIVDKINEEDAADELVILNIFLKTKGPSIYDFEANNESALKVRKSIVNESEFILIRFAVTKESIKKEAKIHEKLEQSMENIKHKVLNDFIHIIRNGSKVIFRKKIHEIDFQYLDRLGLIQKNTIKIFNTNDGFYCEVGHNMKQQEHKNDGY